jgi:hypothetical protein
MHEICLYYYRTCDKTFGNEGALATHKLACAREVDADLLFRARAEVEAMETRSFFDWDEWALNRVDQMTSEVLARQSEGRSSDAEDEGEGGGAPEGMSIVRSEDKPRKKRFRYKLSEKIVLLNNFQIVQSSIKGSRGEEPLKKEVVRVVLTFCPGLKRKY